MQLRLGRADLRVPLAYKNDGLVSAMYVKAVVDNGWYLHNPFLGAPAGLDLADFPMSDSLHFLLVKLLALFTEDHVLIFNGYFLLTFPLTTLTSLLVLRHGGVAAGPAVVASLLFTFLPYHFFRGPHHLWLAAYYLVPPAVMVALWVHDGTLAGRRWWVGLAVCALVSSAGVYYAFFACYLLLVAGLAAGLRERRFAPLGRAFPLVGVVAAGVLLNLAPTFLLRLEQGPATEAIVRHAGEAEMQGLKLAHLLLPVYDHPLRAFADLRKNYRILTPFNGENEWMALGLAGTVGFLLLLGRLALRPAGSSVADGLTVLNIAAVLLGCVGGLGSVFAFLVSPMIRAYNRIGIYIAFLAFFMLALLLEWAVRRCGPTPRGRLTAAALLGLVLVGGIWDLTSGYTKQLYIQDHAGHASDAEFVRAIELSLPEQALIFQLPYVPFPEPGTRHDMKDYDHLRPYLHSRTLRWSHGAMHGRVGDVWQRLVAARPVVEMLHDLAIADFAGLYLDRAGYADRGADLEARVRAAVGAAPRVSRDGRLAFFDLRKYARQLRESYSPDRLQDERERVLLPLVFSWSGGFSALEEAGGETWRWCSGSGTFHVLNPGSRSRRVTLAFGLRAAQMEAAPLQLAGGVLAADLEVGGTEVALERTVEVPPGLHVVRFRSAAHSVRPINDARALVFEVRNFRVKTHDAASGGKATAAR